jgi:hypothetical protein
MLRIDVYNFVSGRGEYLRSFDSLERMLEVMRPISMIPGNQIGFVIYVDDRPVDVMLF